jgi:hypothetical protein
MTHPWHGPFIDCPGCGLRLSESEAREHLCPEFDEGHLTQGGQGRDPESLQGDAKSLVVVAILAAVVGFLLWAITHGGASPL